MPKFTVLLPTHDHADTLWWSVGSVLAQTRQDFELFIVGDGVHDRTREIVAALMQRDRRIRFFDNPKGPRNGENHRHRALQEAKGELICYQADDDLWLPDHLEALEHLLADHDLAHTMQIVISPGGLPPQTWFFDAQLPSEVEALRRNQTGFSSANTGHTIGAYRSLPFGWRETPPGLKVDLYMWRRFLEQPGCRVASLPRPTVVGFPSPVRKGWTIPSRAAELACWSARLTSAAERHALIRTAMEPLCARTHAEKVSAVARAALLTAALEALHADLPHGLASQKTTVRGATPYKPGTTLTFAAGGNGSGFLTKGFSQPEEWGVWSDERSAMIVLPLEQPLNTDAQLALHYSSLLVPDLHECMRVELSVNGEPAAAWDVTLAKQSDRRVILLPAHVLRESRAVVIRFQLKHPVRPVDLKLSEDQRLLGLGLISLSLDRAA